MEMQPNLYERRLAKNLTQEELGDAIGVTATSISSWENGMYHPEVDMLYKLAKTLNCSPIDLLIGQIQHFVCDGNKKIDLWVSLNIDSLMMSARKEKPDSYAAYLLLQGALRVVSRISQNPVQPRKPVMRRGPRKKKE